MRIVTIDFETFFSNEYSLKRMTTEAYIRDPRFEVHGAAVKWRSDLEARWYNARQLKQILADEDWSNTAILAHHVQFDGFVLSHHFNVRPKIWLDTLSMSRLCLGNHVSVSLDAVRAHFGLPPKRTPYDQFKGKHASELDEDARNLLADGCCDEVESIYKIFLKLAVIFPKSEYEVIDLTVRMFTEPVLRADLSLLAKLWGEEENAKCLKLTALGVAAGDLASTVKFVALLRAEGVDIRHKEGKNGSIPALAKTDDWMRELVQHANPRVSELAQARLGIKSTLLQTRSETLGFMAQRGPLAVYLRYCGAHTTRWSGGDASNFQNFRRDSALRHAVLAPPGQLLATVDLSQIECRILNHIAGQTDVIDNFRAGRDPYVGIASHFYGRDITKNDAAERGTGKQAELSCGYGCGWKRFQGVAKLGIYGPPVNLEDDQAQRAVDVYRRTHPRVVQLWQHAESALSKIAGRESLEFLECMYIKNAKLYLPNGAWINYDTLKWDHNITSWRMNTRQGWTKMYGAKLVENFTQALARVILSEAGVRIARTGFRPVLSSHDEWTFLVPQDGREQQALAFIMTEMKREPKWLPGIPIDCEGYLGERYAK